MNFFIEQQFFYNHLQNDHQMELRFKELEEKCRSEEQPKFLLPDMNHYSNSFQGNGPGNVSTPPKINRRRREIIVVLFIV